jgi:hypothetical protein
LVRTWSSIVFHAEVGPLAPEGTVQVLPSSTVISSSHLVIGEADDERAIADAYDCDRRVAVEVTTREEFDLGTALRVLAAQSRGEAALA